MLACRIHCRFFWPCHSFVLCLVVNGCHALAKPWLTISKGWRTVFGSGTPLSFERSKSGQTHLHVWILKKGLIPFFSYIKMQQLNSLLAVLATNAPIYVYVHSETTCNQVLRLLPLRVCAAHCGPWSPSLTFLQNDEVGCRRLDVYLCWLLISAFPQPLQSILAHRICRPWLSALTNQCEADTFSVNFTISSCLFIVAWGISRIRRASTQYHSSNWIPSIWSQLHKVFNIWNWGKNLWCHRSLTYHRPIVSGR